MIQFPSPHGDKLKALLGNSKLPSTDKPRIQAAIKRYNDWLSRMKTLQSDKSSILEGYLSLFNEYKRYIDLDLIFDSEKDFLYRQKGQLKIDNTVIEEFLPHLVNAYFRDEFASLDLRLGPTTCISGIRFDSSLSNKMPGGGIQLRQKDQDFAISRKIFIKTSHDQDFGTFVTKKSYIVFIACECKTNLDKTMFQEAAATALDVKTTVPCARYFLLCEWLDMTPISTGTTAIDEIIIFRKAKRLSSNVRKEFNFSKIRKKWRSSYVDHLDSHPFSVDTFGRFLNHIERLLRNDGEGEVLDRGYF